MSDEDYKSDPMFAVMKEAIKSIGGSEMLGALLGFRSGRSIRKWKRVPAEYCLRVEALAGSCRYCLRPDVYGPHLSEHETDIDLTEDDLGDDV